MGNDIGSHFLCKDAGNAGPWEDSWMTHIQTLPQVCTRLHAEHKEGENLGPTDTSNSGYDNYLSAY